MTLLAPQFLYAALATAAAAVVLHFLVTRQPRAGVLPTARFIPDGAATAARRAARPTDLPLLLLRVALILATGFGLARPISTPPRRAEARVIIVDASRSVRDVTAIRDAARREYRVGDAVIVFDSAARLLTGHAADSLSHLTPSAHVGRLSAALVAAMRAASVLGASADSLDLVIVSPLDAEEADAATTGIRSLWPGRARLLRVGGGTPTAGDRASPIELRAPPADPLTIAVDRARASRGAGALIVRDSAFAPPATAVAGRALVHWPIAARPRGAVQRARRDTSGGIIAGGAVVVAPFERSWRFPHDSLRGTRTIARWMDGEPAAVEWMNASDCVRSVAVPVSAVGDLVLRADFAALVSRLGRECTGAEPPAPMSETMMASLVSTGGRASRRAFAPHRDEHSVISPWLFGLAIALALIELAVRVGRKGADAVAHGGAHRLAA